jgi:DNA processing protein
MPQTDQDLFYKIALSLIPGIGSVLARNLLARLGRVEQVFSESFKSLKKIPGIGEINARRIKDESVYIQAEKELKFIKKYNIQVSFFTDKSYPRRLRSCIDAPVILYCRGNMDLNWPKVLCIVGTRNATTYGKEICGQLIKNISGRGHKIIIISGLAYGIDIHVHKMSLKYGIPTVGILGHGLDRLYPSLHSDTAKKMLKSGGLVTEFPSRTKIDPSNFIRRNRIIAGLSDATVVVESAEKGGALVTADIASSYNRDVFTFPGRVTDTYSRGCNKLIRYNEANLIQGIEDLEYFMGWESTDNTEYLQTEMFVDLIPEEIKIIELLKKSDRLFIDQISSELGMPGSKVSALLLELECKNIISALPGKLYSVK